MVRLGVFVLMWKTPKLLSVCVAWFLKILLPSFATFWKNGSVYYASDRYVYIAIAGLCILCMSLVAPYLHRYKAVGGAVLLALALLTVKQSLTWKNTVTTYERAMEFNPRPILPLNNLGAYFFQNEDLPKAKDY